MRKIKLFTLLAIFAATLSGCTEKYYGAQVLTREYVVIPADWTRNQGPNNPGSDNYLYAEKKNPDITPDVLANGTVTADVYALFDVQNNLGSWHPLPYVYPLEVITQNADGTTQLVIAPENIRMEWVQGNVTFIIQDIDGFDPESINAPITFRVTVTSNM